MSSNSRKIPEKIKLQLRSEANFGCCKCGSPILEYHHILQWSQVKRHKADDMMVLCPLCHTSIDSYPVDKQRDFKLNPFNKINTPSGGEIIAFQQKTIVELGGLSIIGDGPILSEEGQTFFGYRISEDGAFLISLTLKDPSGNVILIIFENEWIRGNLDVFDFEFRAGSKYLSITEKEGSSKFQIDTRNDRFIVDGCFNLSCGKVIFDQTGIVVNGNKLFSIDKGQSNKFGIMHFTKKAFKMKIEKGAPLTGSKYLSGCRLDFIYRGELIIHPKEIPYSSNSASPASAKQLLSSHHRLIETIEACNENITINDELSNNTLFANGMSIWDKEISNIFFVINLADFHKSNKNYSAAIDQLSKVRAQLHEHYKSPNVLQGEINFDLSKILHEIGDVSNSKYLFEQAVICFGAAGSLPHRLLSFGDVIYHPSDNCYCGQSVEYGKCHQKFAQLNRYGITTKRAVRIINAPENCKVSIFAREPKNFHWKLSNQDYENGWKLVFSGTGTKDFSYSISSINDIPFALRIDTYGYQPLIIESILRSNDFVIPITRK